MKERKDEGVRERDGFNLPSAKHRQMIQNIYVLPVLPWSEETRDCDDLLSFFGLR